MNFLIVVPRFVRQGFYYDFPLGLAYISQALKDAGHNITCLNLNKCNNTIERLFDETIKKNDIDVFCTGALSPFFSTIKEMLILAKAIKPELKTIVGGGLITAEPELVMKLLENADIGVIGEGENTIVETAKALSEGLQVDYIPGLVYKNNGKFQQTAKRSPIKNIDILPYPDYENMGIKQYLDMQYPNDVDSFNFFDDPRVMPLIASRGCPYHCTFCFSPLGKRYRQHSINYILEHIDYLIEHYHVNGIFILDELFSTKASHARLIEFCERIKERNIQWMAQLRGDSVNKNILGLMRESGCVLISYGIESASNKILKSMRKQITIGEITKALEWTYQAKIGNKGNIIFGDREETSATFRQSLRWWQKYRKFQIQLSRITVYPGCPSYHYAIKQGIIEDQEEFISGIPQQLNLTKMPNEALYTMLDWSTQLRRFAGMPGRMIECKKTGYDSIKGATYSFIVCCPHCEQKIQYHNMNHQIKEKYLLYCKECRQKFRVLPFNVESGIDSIIKILKDKQVAIWYTEAMVFFQLAVRLIEHIDYVIGPESIEQQSIQSKQIIQYENAAQINKVVDVVIYPITVLADIIHAMALMQNGVNLMPLYAFENNESAFDIVNYLAYNRDWGQALTTLQQMSDQMPNIYLTEQTLKVLDELGVEMG